MLTGFKDKDIQLSICAKVKVQLQVIYWQPALVWSDDQTREEHVTFSLFSYINAAQIHLSVILSQFWCARGSGILQPGGMEEEGSPAIGNSRVRSVCLLKLLLTMSTVLWRRVGGVGHDGQLLQGDQLIANHRPCYPDTLVSLLALATSDG